MEEPTEEQEAQPKPKKAGLDLTKILLIVLIVAVVGVGAVFLTKGGCGSGGGAGKGGGGKDGDKPSEAPKTTVSLIDLPQQVTSNRLQQIVQWELTIKIRDDEKQTLGAEWSRPEKKKELTDKVIGVVQGIDFSVPRPDPLDRFKSALTKSLDETFGAEGTVEDIEVTKWVATPR